jgi:hypothetical protein
MLVDLDSNVNASQMVINPDSDDSASETLGRKRKGAPENPDDGNKENLSPDDTPPHKRTRRPSIHADQLESISTDTLSLPPHRSPPLAISAPYTLPPLDKGVNPTDNPHTPPPCGALLVDESHLSDHLWNYPTLSHILSGSLSEPRLGGFSEAGELLSSSASCPGQCS